jgi:hypothetical protein
MDVVKERHIESHRLFELAQMFRSIDQPDWAHIWNCVECGTAFLMLKSVIERSAEVETGWRACIVDPSLSFE